MARAASPVVTVYRERQRMLTEKCIFAVDTHTAGEPTRIVIGGLGMIPGDTILEKKQYLERELDSLRIMLMHEPRGHRDMFGAVILPPCDPRADAGIVFMHSGAYQEMCGHGCIGAVTALLELGIVKGREGRNTVVLDTPVGLVHAEAEMGCGHVTCVYIQNVPSFLYREGLEVELPSYGMLPVSIAFGGNFFALVDISRLSLEIAPQRVEQLVGLGMEVLGQVRCMEPAIHPLLPEVRGVAMAELYTKSPTPGVDARNIVVFGNRQFDRSPCGTGTSAKLAALYRRGELRLGQPYTHESVIGTVFRGRAVEETWVGLLPAVIPEIQGEAFITGIHQFVRHPDDLAGKGFLV